MSTHHITVDRQLSALIGTERGADQFMQIIKQGLKIYNELIKYFP